MEPDDGEVYTINCFTATIAALAIVIAVGAADSACEARLTVTSRPARIDTAVVTTGSR